MRTPEEIVAACLAEEEETQGMVKFCRDRLAAITDAVQGYTTEYGTCHGQDELLFVAGFRNDLQNARTSCGFSIDVRRQPDGRLLAADLPVETW